MRIGISAGHGTIIAMLGALAVGGCAVQGPDIVKTDQPVRVDGVLDEPCWSEAAAVPVDTLHGEQGKGRAADSPRMVVKYAWDEHYLYIGYETFDANLQAANADELEGPAGNRRAAAVNWQPDAKLDVVEFFVSFERDDIFWEIHQNALNGFTDVCVFYTHADWPKDLSMTNSGIYFARRQHIEDVKEMDASHKSHGPYTVKTAVAVKPRADGERSTINDDSDEDAGYIGEIRLPWGGVGAPNDWRIWYEKDVPGQADPYRWPGPWSRVDGRTIRLLAVCQNADHEVKYSHAGPRHIPSWFHKAYAAWPRYRLVESGK